MCSGVCSSEPHSHWAESARRFLFRCFLSPQWPVRRWKMVVWVLLPIFLSVLLLLLLLNVCVCVLSWMAWLVLSFSPSSLPWLLLDCLLFVCLCWCCFCSPDLFVLCSLNLSLSLSLSLSVSLSLLSSPLLSSTPRPHGFWCAG